MHRLSLGIVLLPWIVAPLAGQSRPFGQGCQGPLTEVPAMELSAPPVVNTTFNLEIDAKAPNAAFLFVLGLSNQSWGGVPLPLDMTLFGFPGCFLNIEFRRPFGLTSNANGVVNLPVQATGLPVGARIYSQIVVADPGTSGTIAASRGYEITMVASVQPFSLLVIPDTQKYVKTPAYITHFDEQAKWIVNNLSSENIAFVSHVGDVVENGAAGTNKNQSEWDLVVGVMARLDGNLGNKPDGLVPYSVVLGNADYNINGTKPIATQWGKYFGPARTNTRTWYVGSSTNGQNQAQIFESGGLKFLHIGLEWRAHDDALAWAQSVILANPELPTIVSTHQYVGPHAAPNYDDKGAALTSGGDNGGFGIRQKLVEPFPQVFLVVSGHRPGAKFQSPATVLGHLVHEFRFDYQEDPNGGNGWLNQLEFFPNLAELGSDCFSPTYIPGTTIGNDWNSDPRSNFTVKFDLHLHRRTLETTKTLHFTDGHDHGNGIYTGVRDTYIRSDSPDRSYGTDNKVRTDRDADLSQEHGLIQFKDLFGTSAGQIPTNRHIVKAILTLTTEGSGAKSNTVSEFYQLKVPFTEFSTWNSLTGGIQIGTDTLASPVANNDKLVATESTRSFDVTASLHSWQGGSPNHGWAMINLGLDSWSFRSSEFGTALERPMLTVIYEK